MEKLIDKSNTNPLNKKKLEDLYSFDVFDTLITRRTATPTGIFALIQRELNIKPEFNNLPSYIKKDFFQIRINAEKCSRALKHANEQSREVNIYEIYNNIQESYCLSEEQKIKLLNLEIEVESKNIIPIDCNIQKLKNLYVQNKKIILISDMYLTSELISYLLKPYIDFIDNIKIYVSCEYKACKNNGRIYKLIKKELSPLKWHHIGDNQKADYKSAKEQGINANLFTYPQLESYEKSILSQHENNIDYQLLIGNCRNIRLISSKDLKTSIGISLAGPILTAYVNWIIHVSLEKNINRLYFIARDGYILKEIADVLIEKYNHPITTKYIYGSRLAWRAPSIEYNETNYSEILDFLLLDSASLTDMTKISPRELQKFIKKTYINRYLKPTEKENLKKNLLKNKDFWNLIIEKNKTQRNLVIQYLKQEIDFCDNKFAFVDLAGSGNTNNCLAKIINTFYPEKFNTFYMQMNKNIVPANLVNRYCYLYTDIPFLYLEVLARAPHGQTLGYKKEIDKIVPILENLNVKNIKKWDFDSYINGVKLYAKYSEIQPSLELLEQFFIAINATDKTIMSAFSDQIFSCTGKNENDKFAPAFGIKETISFLLFNKPLKSNLLNWSLKLTKPYLRKIIEFKYKYESLGKFFINTHFSKEKKEFFIIILGIKISLRSLIWRKK